MSLTKLLVPAFFITLGSLNAFGADLPKDDKDFACTDSQVAQKYVRDFKIDLQSFGGMELCNAKVDTKKLFNDLEVIEKGAFSGDKTNTFIRGMVDSRNYYSWMKSMTYGVNRGHDVPWATAYNRGGYFTMQDGWTKLSTLGRVGTIIHEARHTQGYVHMECDHGPYADSGLPGCDSSIEQKGSHGVEMEYYSRVVLQGTNFHPVYKSMARLMNLGRANFVFNANPLVKSDGLVALTAEKASLLTADKSYDLAVPNTANLILKQTSFGASLFAHDNAYAIDFYSLAQGKEPINDDFSYYKLIRSEKLAAPQDLEEVDIGGLRYLLAIGDNSQVYTFVFADGEWSQPVTINGAKALSSTAPDGTKGVFVIKNNGRICQLDPKSLDCSDLQRSWPAGTSAFTKYQNNLLELRNDGTVLNASGKAFAPLADQKVEQLVSAPVMDAFPLPKDE